MPTKQEIYESQIKPLFEQAKAIAEQEGLNIVTLASYADEIKATCEGFTTINNEANGYQPHITIVGMMLELEVELVGELIPKLMPLVLAARTGDLTNIANPDGEEAA